MNAETQAAELAGRFNLRKRARSWGGDCPSCSYRGAFSLKIGRKTPRPALFCANGCTREQLSEVAKMALGNAWEPSPAPNGDEVAKARAAKQAAALRLWNGSDRCAGTPAAIYLERRGLKHLIGSAALRFRADTWHSERGRYPALIACVQDGAGTLLGVHRTYIDRNGAKAALDPPKASLGPIWGGAIRLMPATTEMVVGEGIETAASAGVLLGLPAWAAISAGNMAAAMVLPPGVRRVVIAVDPDGPGRKAARDAAARWRGEGRQLSLAEPNRAGVDFNDLLLERQHA